MNEQRPSKEEVEEAFRVAEADRAKNWIGGAWLEKNCQRLMLVLVKENLSLKAELADAMSTSAQIWKNRSEKSEVMLAAAKKVMEAARNHSCLMGNRQLKESIAAYDATGKGDL